MRLLTMTPRLDGLCEDLPPNRARRAVELVAYLALHQPDGITGDRLRTRVLGSSDADAASKTLFNTATRRAVPWASTSTESRSSPPAAARGSINPRRHATVDVHRAIALAGEGRSQADPAVAIAHFRAALDLVEGEPLANALSGVFAAGRRGARRARRRGARRRRVLPGGPGGRCRFELRWGLERRASGGALQRSALPAAMQLAATEGRRRPAPIRMARAPAPGSMPSTRQLAVDAHRLP